jgi:tetratricopeptide (TPR) repeat protein
MFDYPPPAGVLKYVTNMTEEEFEECIRELILVSLVIPEQVKTGQEQIAPHYTLLSLTRGFVVNQLDHDSQLKGEIEERIRVVQSTFEDAERAKKQYRFSLFNLGAITEEEKIAALLVQTAYQKYQGGRYPDALDDYKRASEIAPRFTSVYRNWAVMESNEEHHIEADNLMKRAVELNPKDAQIWLTWGNMKRKIDRIKEALDYYLKANELSPKDYVILNALGQARCRLGDYEPADLLFREALESDSAAGSSLRHEIINRSSLADNLRRWAESLLKDRDFTKAENKLIEALDHCEKALKLHEDDNRTKSLHRKILLDLGYYYYKNNDIPKSIEYFKGLIVENPTKFSEVQDTIRATKAIIKIYVKEDNLAAALSFFTNKIGRHAKRIDPNSYKEITQMINELKRDGAIDGKIIFVNSNKGFCIIESINTPGDTYLGHINSFIPKILELNDSYANTDVSFLPEFDQDKNRKSAKAIKTILK